MNENTNPVLVVFGAGEGISFETAGKFLNEGYEVVLVSRTMERLQKMQQMLSAEKVQIYQADVTDEDRMTELCREIKTRNSNIQVVLYNPANIHGGSVLETSYNDWIEDFKVNVAALVTVAKEFKTVLAKNEGSLLITNGAIALHPMDLCASLSVGKAALRSLTILLRQELSKEKIFVGSILVDGVVTKDSPLHSPKNIAETYWGMTVERKTTEIIL